MRQNKSITTKQIVMVALLAAMTCAGSALRIKVPEVVGTSAFHLGNILCALSGILLGPWLGGLAAGLGSAIYDMFDPIYIRDAWITFLTKGMYALIAGMVIRSGSGRWGYGKAIIATTAGALTYAVLYLCKGIFYDGMLLNGLTAAAAAIAVTAKLPATTFNVVVAIVGAPLIAIALRKALSRSHLSVD